MRKQCLIREVNRRLEAQYGAQAITAAPGVLVGSTRMGAYAELKRGLLAIKPSSIEETADALHRASQLQQPEQLLRLGGPARRLPPEELATELVKSVSAHTLVDWMNDMLLDMRIVQDPAGIEAIRTASIGVVRDLGARGVLLEQALSDLQGQENDRTPALVANLFSGRLTWMNGVVRLALAGAIVPHELGHWVAGKLAGAAASAPLRRHHFLNAKSGEAPGAPA